MSDNLQSRAMARSATTQAVIAAKLEKRWAAPGTAQGLALALCLVLTAVSAAASAGPNPDPRGTNPAEAQLRLESKLGGGAVLVRDLLVLRDVSAPADLPSRAPVTATLYYRGGQQSTVETELHVLLISDAPTSQSKGPVIGIIVPEELRGRIGQLMSVSVVVHLPSAR